MQTLNLFSDTSSTNIICKCFKVNSFLEHLMNFITVTGLERKKKLSS